MPLFGRGRVTSCERGKSRKMVYPCAFIVDLNILENGSNETSAMSARPEGGSVFFSWSFLPPKTDPAKEMIEQMRL